ncbi:MAG: mechanosensitive ion channel family protein [Bacillota bacterium]|nr:mechanosensitive ion channel family protein [Bacillota bacterium]
MRLLLVLVLTRAGITFSSYAIKRSLAQYSSRPRLGGSEARANTIGALLRSVSRYVLYFVGFVWAMDAIGIRAGSIMAAAGIGGLAVGFGAQNLVRDVISGFFILFEDQYEVGEFVTIDGASGIVEEVGLRSTRIRAFAGDVYFVPNGSIAKVTNHSRGDMRAWVEVSISYECDHNHAIEVANRACAALAGRLDYVVEGPKVMGIQNLGESGVVLSIWGKAQNMKQWALEREIRKEVKEAFEREGVEIPYPRTVVIHRREEEPSRSAGPSGPAGPEGGRAGDTGESW